MKRIRLKWLKKHRFTEKGFRPYVLAIGQLSLAWNDLHEKLGMMFVMLMGGGWVNLPAAVWQSANFDRPKRAMLRAAVQNQTTKFEIQYPRLKADLLYILAECESIEDARNNAVHSPLLLGTFGPLNAGLTKQWERVGKPFVFPDLLLQHPRARNLSSKKDLLAEFRWCRDAALVLRDFIVLIDYAMDARGRGGAWPDRPSLPNRGEKKKLKSGRPRSHPSRLPPPPRS